MCFRTLIEGVLILTDWEEEYFLLLGFWIKDLYVAPWMGQKKYLKNMLRMKRKRTEHVILYICTVHIC